MVSNLLRHMRMLRCAGGSVRGGSRNAPMLPAVISSGQRATPGLSPPFLGHLRSPVVLWHSCEHLLWRPCVSWQSAAGLPGEGNIPERVPSLLLQLHVHDLLHEQNLLNDQIPHTAHIRAYQDRLAGTSDRVDCTVSPSMWDIMCSAGNGQSNQCWLLYIVANCIACSRKEGLQSGLDLARATGQTSLLRRHVRCSETCALLLP